MKKRERNVTEYTPMRSEVIVGGNFTRQDTKWKNKTAAASWEYGNIGTAISKKFDTNM